MFNNRIKTFRGCCECLTPSRAITTAKDMIFEIITDGMPSEEWWALVQNLRDDSSFYLSCPEIGKWSYSGADWGRKVMEGQ